MIPGVPKGLRRQVRDGFYKALMNDPKLANNRVIKTWMTWDSDNAVIAEPTEAQMPAAMLQMIGETVTRRTGSRAPGKPMTHINESTVTIVITLWTRGTDQGDLADVADLIHSALSPQDPEARTALQERFKQSGISDWQLVRGIAPMSGEGFSEVAVAGQGTYQLTFFSYA